MTKRVKKTFTLAEVLITLAIIGVVAALTIPTLWAKINEKVIENQKEVIVDRLITGFNQLNTLDDGFNASQYENTKQFVEALSKYYKMSQICDTNEITNCLPYATINYADKDSEGNITNSGTIDVSTLKTIEQFMNNNT